jgi:Competence protein CoiA-like family
LLYAYVKEKNGLEDGETINKDGQSFIVIKSIDVVNKQIEKKYEYFCLSCNRQVFFRHYKDKHEHFYHRGSQECKIPESIEHLLVKMEIYKIQCYKKLGLRQEAEETIKRIADSHEEEVKKLEENSSDNFILIIKLLEDAIKIYRTLPSMKQQIERLLKFTQPSYDRSKLGIRG